MKTKYLIAALLCWFAFSSVWATPGTVDEKKMAAPAAGKSSGGLYSNYGILGEPTVGLQNNGTTNNVFGFLGGLDFSIVINTNSVVMDGSDVSRAICYCSITDDAGYTISSRGICRNSTGNPEKTENQVACGSGNGNFSGTFTGLSSATTYYIRAWATTSTGTTVYGNQLTYTTIPTLGEWGLIAFLSLIGLIGGIVIWRKLC